MDVLIFPQVKAVKGRSSTPTMRLVSFYAKLKQSLGLTTQCLSLSLTTLQAVLVKKICQSVTIIFRCLFMRRSIFSRAKLTLWPVKLILPQPCLDYSINPMRAPSLVVTCCGLKRQSEDVRY